MQYRRATPADYPTLVRITADNARDNPDAAARGHGFLTGHFDAAKFAAFDADLGIVVADHDGQVAGFLCSATREFAAHTPILRAMLDGCRGAGFGGRPISAFRSFLYGPACVAPPWHGHGVLRGMYTHLKRELQPRFEVGILFIDGDNPHSLTVHEQGLGMARIGAFEFNRRRYFILAFRCGD